MKLMTVEVGQIRREPGMQARVETNEDVARDYSEVLLAGERLPAPVVFFDGTDYFLADGWHTVRAHELAECGHITVGVHEGSRRDALLYACGANATHGLRRTNADKRRAISLLLEDKEFSTWPNTQIAHACAVTEGCVRWFRLELKEVAELKRREALQAMPAVYETTQPVVPAKEAEVTAEEGLAQIEALAGRLRRVLGPGEAVRPALEIVERYLGVLRQAVGWEEEPEVELDEQNLKKAKTLVDRMRKLHAELPAARRAAKVLDRFWTTLTRAAAGSKESTSVAC